MTITPTDRQVDLMKHAVGYDSREPFYRNHFCAGAGSDDDTEWASLVTLGYACLVKQPIARDNVYAVSDAGKTFLRTMRPQPTPDHWRPGDRIPGPDDLQPGSLIVWKHKPRGGWGYTIRVPGVVTSVGRSTVSVDLRLANGTTRHRTVPRSSIVLTSRTP